MNFNENTSIKTIGDVAQFAQYLSRDLRILFHPDDDFADYINYETGEPTFTTDRAALMNERMAECFSVCDANHADIYELMSLASC